MISEDFRAYDQFRIAGPRCAALRMPKKARIRGVHEHAGGRAALLALGVHPRLASNTAGSGRGSWYLAHAKALSVALSSAYFKSFGLPTLEEKR